LEWVDYNYEAYLSLKQIDEIEDTKGAFQESDKKYKRLLDNSKYIEDEHNRILAILEESLKKINSYEKLILEAQQEKNSNRSLSKFDSDINKLFEKVRYFEGNQIAEEIDQQYY